MRIFLSCCFCCIFLSARAQNTIGLPEIINYNKQQYNAGTQNWDIAQGENGLIYFGNNEGLLSFDGTFWKIYPLPNKTIVRSLEIAPDNKIYAGGQNEFGFFYPGERGILEYHSLIHLVPEQERTFDDVWDICVFKGSVFFRTNSKIFRLTGNEIVVYPTTTEWRFMAVCNGQLIAEDREGMLVYETRRWKSVFRNAALPVDALITSIIPLNNTSSLISTLKQGFFVYNKGAQLYRMSTADMRFLSELNVYKSIRLRDGKIAIATSMGGCFIIDTTGNMVQRLTVSEGLQNNNIRSIFQDRDNNLWLGLENGIDFTAYDNAIKHIYPGPHNMGSGYAAIAYKNYMYLGTSSGLYRFRLSENKDHSYDKSKIEKVLHSEGEAWNLSIVNEHLFMGHHTGAYTIRDNKAVLFDDKIGFWTFLPLSNKRPSDLMVAGNYLGLGIYRYEGSHFNPEGRYFPLESARFVVVENEHTVWVAHPYKGIFRVTIGSNDSLSVQLFMDNTGLPSANNNYIFKIDNQVIIASETGLYKLNENRDSFVPATELNKKITAKNIRYLREDAVGNIWFVHDKQVSVLDQTSDTSRVINFSELNNKLVNGFESVYPMDKNNIIIGSEKGFFHVDYEKYKNSTRTFRTKVREVHALSNNDSLLYAGYGLPEMATLPYKRNSLHFEFSAILYGQQSNIEYSYYLKNFDSKWSPWNFKTEKDYTNLPPGDYELMVKARTNLGNESAISTYKFVIHPPWYLSLPAKIVYALLVVLVGYLLIRYQKNKFRSQQLKYEEKQKQLKYMHQLEIDKSEKEIVKLKNEKLETEIEHKNYELATSAMHLLQKKEMMDKLRDDLNGMMKNIDDDETFSKCRKLIKALGEDTKLDDSWNHFEMHFDKIHTDFLVQIKQKYPELTAGELRLCAYIRLNLSTKEIAKLLNISIRGVETSRYRLRKKLNLDKEQNLFEYLLEEQFSHKKYL